MATQGECGDTPGKRCARRRLSVYGCQMTAKPTLQAVRLRMPNDGKARAATRHRHEPHRRATPASQPYVCWREADVSSATLVVAGIIERDGRVLICQRRADSRHPLKWEFPGGKVEEG
ncbi:MAG: NUDIX domain-containing protein, partial [Bryobacteraceae bacterium]